MADIERVVFYYFYLMDLQIEYTSFFFKMRPAKLVSAIILYIIKDAKIVDNKFIEDQRNIFLKLGVQSYIFLNGTVQII